MGSRREEVLEVREWGGPANHIFEMLTLCCAFCYVLPH